MLKPTGTFWLAIGDDFAAELKLIFQRELGFTCRSWVIWYYTFGVNCTKKFSRSHTHLFHFVKDPKHFTFNADADPRAVGPATGLRRCPRQRRAAGCPTTPGSCGRRTCPTAFSRDEDTWYFPRVCGTFKERAGWHGCQMPEQLLGRIIEVSLESRRSWCSTPSPAAAPRWSVAKKLARRWIGFELSSNYCEHIQGRLEAAAQSASDSRDRPNPTPARLGHHDVGCETDRAPHGSRPLQARSRAVTTATKSACAGCAPALAGIALSSEACHDGP